MDEKRTASPRMSRRDEWYREETESGRTSRGVQTEPTSLDKMLEELYMDSQISSPRLDRKDIERLMDGFEHARCVTAGEPCSGAEGLLDLGDAASENSMEVTRSAEQRTRKIGYCSDNLLNVLEDLNKRYIREYQSNNTGGIEKKMLSPIVEKKLILNQQDSSETEECKSEKSKEPKKKISLGRLSRQGSKDKPGDEGRASRSSPNIEKMVRELLIKHQTEESAFQAIDVVEIERSISNDDSGKSSKKTSAERPKSSSFFPFFSQFKSVKRTRSEGESSGGDAAAIQLDGEALNYDDVTGFWEDVCFTPRTDRKQKERKMSMRRNSSPDVLLSKLRKKLSNSMIVKEKNDSPKEKKGWISGKSSRQNSRDTPTPERMRKQSKQASRQSSRDTPTPEQKRSLSRQVSRQSSREIHTPERKRSQTRHLIHQSSRDTPTPERKRSQSKQNRDVATPERKRSQSKQASRQNSKDTYTPEQKRSQSRHGKKTSKSSDRSTPKTSRRGNRSCDRQDDTVELKRTSSTPELYRRSERRQIKDKTRTSSTPSLRRKPIKQVREPKTELKTETPPLSDRRRYNSEECGRSRSRSKRSHLRGGSSVDAYDWHDAETSHSFFLPLMVMQ